MPSPQIVAHRGASAFRAEHTLAAYELAIEQGAEALECDVRLTSDGHLVCVHDRRINRTSDGWGVVSTKTLDQLQQHDFGSWPRPEPGKRRRLRERSTLARRAQRWFDDEPGDVGGPSDPVLTLPELLDLVVNSPRGIQLAVETKHPTRYAGWVEQAVVAQLRRFGLANPHRDAIAPVRVMSFSAQAMRRMRTLAPAVPTVFLMDSVPIRMRSGALPFGARISGPDLAIIKAHPGYVRRVHAQGGKVHVWTVDDLADVRLCADLGVDAVITNRPGDVAKYLGRTVS